MLHFRFLLSWSPIFGTEACATLRRRVVHTRHNVRGADLLWRHRELHDHAGIAPQAVSVSGRLGDEMPVEPDFLDRRVAVWHSQANGESVFDRSRTLLPFRRLVDRPGTAECLERKAIGHRLQTRGVELRVRL